MLRQFGRFTNDPNAFERGLKLLASLAQIGEANGLADRTVVWRTAKDQLNLARRYFRVFKWIDCWDAALSQYQAYVQAVPAAPTGDKHATPPERDGVKFVLSFSKWSLLGMYLFLEMFVMNTWAPTLQIESLKFWGYALAVSMALGLYELVSLPASATATSERPSKAGREKQKPVPAGAGAKGPDARARAAKKRLIYERLVVDFCDLVLAAWVVGWVELDPIIPGAMSSISAAIDVGNGWTRASAIA